MFIHLTFHADSALCHRGDVKNMLHSVHYELQRRDTGQRLFFPSSRRISVNPACQLSAFQSIPTDRVPCLMGVMMTYRYVRMKNQKVAVEIPFWSCSGGCNNLTHGWIY